MPVTIYFVILQILTTATVAASESCNCKLTAVGAAMPLWAGQSRAGGNIVQGHKHILTSGKSPKSDYIT